MVSPLLLQRRAAIGWTCCACGIGVSRAIVILQPVHAYVPKGEWRYPRLLVATEGSYAVERPARPSTLVVDPHVEEIITLFQ